MSDQLKIVLDKLNIDKAYQHEFSDASFEEISLDEKKKVVKIVLQNKTNLSCDLYFDLKEKLKTYFSGYKVHLSVEAREVDNKFFKDYFYRCVENISKKNPLIDVFSDRLITEDNNYSVEVVNKAEEKQVSSFIKDLNNQMKIFGYEPKIKIAFNEEKRNKIVENIIKDLNVEVKAPIEEVKEKKASKKTNKDNSAIFGYPIKDEAVAIRSIIGEENRITIEGIVFGQEDFVPRSKEFKIITLKVNDDTDSIFCKIFTRRDEDFDNIMKHTKVGSYVKLQGRTKFDNFSGGEIVLNVNNIAKSAKKKKQREDKAPEKRVELHVHTQMSQMDGIANASDIVKLAHAWGHKAIAITDKDSCQSFPEVFNTVKGLNKKIEKHEDKFKVLYGAELTLIEDNVNLVIRPDDRDMLLDTFVVFDFETTGFNAGSGDTIIEIGAVKIKEGKIIDKFSQLIDPKRPLPAKITEITGITGKMLEGQIEEDEAVASFLEWIGDLPVVAHNAKFDMSFLEMAIKKYNFKKFNNPVIDTLELSRQLDKEFSRHGLSALVKRYEVPFDEDSHHRGDYDAEATALVFYKMAQKLSNQDILLLNDLNKLINKDEIYKYGRSYHVNLIAKNLVGLKNLYKILSIASTDYLHQGSARILRTVLDENRDGLLIGSGCYASEVFVEARSKSEDELKDIIAFYDYVEVQPPEVYDHLIQMSDFENMKDLKDHIKKIIRVVSETDTLIVASGDVHHIEDADKIFREIIINQKVPGGGRHVLARNNITSIPSSYFRTTDEMLTAFDFIDQDLRETIVIANPNKIADLVEEVDVVPDTKGIPFSPVIENSRETTKQIVYDEAHELYGELLPKIVEERIASELEGIFNGGFDVIYLIAQKLVKKSNDDGYLVGSRGSVGSSFVAYLMGISEVNPIEAHYACPNCKHSIFEEDGKMLSYTYSSGFDLAKKDCPKCGTTMNRDGHDMPFATFLGFKADKVPDIDLNFSGEYQALAHDYTKELFGIDNVFRAGTIGTVADKTAYGFVKGYCEDKGIEMRSAEIERLAAGVVGVKRTTGQHPGGIVVVPDYKDISDFTPYQFPAGDKNSAWRTTHFDYHAIEECLLKLDILGHDDPTVLKILQDLSGIDVTKLDPADPKVISLFTSTDALGASSDDIGCEIGVLGLPEFGTDNTINMLIETKPTNYAGLVKISGLSHGTDVWAGNASDLIKNEVVTFDEVIGCRDDIMVYLMKNGMEPLDAFKIMEFVRKGKASKETDEWAKWSSKMRENNIPEWYIESCYKIKYMFPKAHACAYVLSALRIAWFKVYHPLWYYAAYFSVRTSDFDVETMIKGYNAIKIKIAEINAKGFEASNKDAGILIGLRCAQEAAARGIKFAPVSLEKSLPNLFVLDGEVTLIPSFSTIEGLGSTVANLIVSEREKRPFISIEDLQKRAKVSSTIIEKMRLMGMLEGMPESSQLTLF